MPQTSKTYLFSNSDLNFNLAAALVYPIIAAGDLLLRLRHGFDNDDAEVQIGPIAASLTVVKMGAGFTVLLAAICLRRKAEVGGELLAAYFITTLATFLVLILTAFDCKVVGLSPSRCIGSIFLLPAPNLPTDPPLNNLLDASDLLNPLVYLPFQGYLLFIGTTAPVHNFFWLCIYIYILLLASHFLRGYRVSWKSTFHYLDLVMVGYLSHWVTFVFGSFSISFFMIDF